jgi:hypothetical protein
MPGKSRRGRGRHLPRGKRRKGRKAFSAPVAQSSAVGQAYEPAPGADMLVPSAKAPTPKPTVTAAQHPNVAAELRRIGILAGIIVVILVVLALIFS